MYDERLNNRVFDKLNNALSIFERMVYEPVGELGDVKALCTKEHLRSVPTEGLEPIKKGTSWGGEWENLWIKGSFTVPAELDGKKIYAVSRCGGKEQLFFVNGKPKGLFNSKNHDFIGGGHASQFIKEAKGGEKIDLAFECYAGHYDPNTDPYDYYFERDPRQTFSHSYGGVDICTRNDELFTLIFDIRELLGARNLPDDNFVAARARKILLKVNDVLVRYPADTSHEKFMESVRAALKITRPFFRGENDPIFGRVAILGHSHMDTAWLWPVSETIRKCARTYSNALNLMDQYPSYKFVQSSALHCEWMKDYYPDIFEEMKKRVAEGRYEPNGGVYVECDCNITSGELMARQFLKGQQFTRENFGYTSDSFWLPDTFGYNANIPQIMRKSEVKYFYTTKIFWNELNSFPFMSFVWKGLDGSDVITHFNRTHCWPDAGSVASATRELPQKEATDLRLVAYGFGDGGGGPTPGMIETSLRSSNMDGLPEVKSMTVSDFGKELEKQKGDLPVYDDELYLELHRGTLTQMHEIKRKNRKAEYSLRDMEYFNVLSGEKRHEMSDKWLKTLLKNQFHDILPGTCIKSVYDIFNPEMAELIENYRAAAKEYAEKLTDKSEKVTLFNTLSFERNDPAVIDAKGFAKGFPSQCYTDLNGKKKLAIGGLKLPGFGSKTIEFADKAEECASPFSYDGTKLETPFAKITFDENGYISSLVDKKSGREMRKEGGEPLGVFLFGEDVPLCWDNWDIERDAIKNLKPVHGFKGRELVTDGAVEIRLKSCFDIGDGTTLAQDMICYADSPRIDFETIVDWKSPHRLLKVGFDLEIKANKARSEIQFGSIERPTTANNSLEAAKFEVCNRNFTDISEPRIGAAVLNDCKYGISVGDCNLRLSLHKGGIHPDTTGDEGRHEMVYSLLVHEGTFNAENVVRPAYELNVPIFAADGEAEAKPFACVDKPNIIVEAVKPAEDETDSFIMRLYECEGSKTDANLKVNAAVSSATETNLLEDEKEKISLNDGAVSLSFGPFEIKTIKFTR